MTGLIAAGCIAAVVVIWAVLRWDELQERRRERRNLRNYDRITVAQWTAHLGTRPPEIAHDDPFAQYVPGRGTPAVHLTATPPAVVPAAVTNLPAGGSTVPAAGMVARETLAQPFRSPAAHETPAAGTPLGAEVTGHLDALRDVVAELARPTDEQQFPHLMPAWEDNTGEFTRFVEDGAQ